MRVIIDKMASYVAKNGTDFEAIVKSKGDPRFVFLNPEHEFHGYYKHKIDVYTDFSKQNAAESSPGNESNSEDVRKMKEKKIIAPVSFSIKKAKESETTIEKSALPVEESDEEKDDCDLPQSSSSVSCSAETTNPATEAPRPEAPPPTAKEDTAVPKKETEEPEAKPSPLLLLPEDPLLELIDLTDDLEERRDAKRAEDRLKDKLAAAAREKLSSSSRDKALQLERKKRAAAFLSQLKSKGGEPKRAKTDAEAIEDHSGSEEEGEIKSGGSSKRPKSSKKKKSHKRKRSKSKHDRKDHKRDREHKKSRKRSRRRDSSSSCNSDR